MFVVSYEPPVVTPTLISRQFLALWSAYTYPVYTYSETRDTSTGLRQLIAWIIADLKIEKGLYSIKYETIQLSHLFLGIGEWKSCFSI